MSGIAGIIRFDGAPVEPGQIEAMTAAMAHRGPDGIAHWSKGAVALGHCMLRTTPESLEEAQPLTNEDASLVLVMDGRVDNWEELRAELIKRGAVLRTRADAELVLRAYEVWGQDCLAHIDGDFALLIWDARRKAVFCARDRLGNKPFHYHWNGKTLAIASELGPILALPWVPRTPNDGMLAEFLIADWFSRDETLWCGIMRLVAAHCMVVDAEGPQAGTYWEPDLWSAPSYKSDEEYVEHYRELLTDSVRRLSRSHRPVATEVSGGLDSSAIFCTAEKLRRAGDLCAPNVEGYTLAFTDESAANELQYARAVGQYLGKPIHEVPPTILPLEWYSERARAFPGSPAFPGGVMLQGLRQEAARQGSRVILNGIGGDEWTCGTRLYYAEELQQRHWSRLYEWFKADVDAYGPAQALRWILGYGILPLLPSRLEKLLRLARQGMNESGPDEFYWLSPAMREEVGSRRDRSSHKRDLKVRRAGQRPQLDLYHAAFRDIGREEDELLSAGLGIENRRPLDTPPLIQFALSTPERLRLRGDVMKHLHILAMRDRMPEIILDRKTKAEFSSVYRLYLDHMQVMITKKIPQDRPDWLDQEGIEQLFRTYKENPELGWPFWILWTIYGCNMLLPNG